MFPSYHNSDWSQPRRNGSLHSVLAATRFWWNEVRWEKVLKRIAVCDTSTAPLQELTCHIGSHTCHPAEVTFPPLPQPIKAGTRFSDPRGMQGWVDLVGPVTYQVGIPVRRRSPVPVLTGLNIDQLRSYDERRYGSAKPPSRWDDWYERWCKLQWRRTTRRRQSGAPSSIVCRQRWWPSKCTRPHHAPSTHLLSPDQSLLRHTSEPTPASEYPPRLRIHNAPVRHRICRLGTL